MTNPTSADPVVATDDWSTVPLHKKWWFQVVLTLLVMPVGLIFVVFVPAYQRRKGQVERVGKGTKAIIAVLAVLLIVFSLARWAASISSDDLEVVDRGMALSIRNVGAGPIEVRDVAINDRAECSKPRPARTLQIGETMGWPTECYSPARATIRTNRGDFTYTFRR